MNIKHHKKFFTTSLNLIHRFYVYMQRHFIFEKKIDMYVLIQRKINHLKKLSIINKLSEFLNKGPKPELE